MKLLKVIFNGAMFIFGIAVMFTIFQLLFTRIESLTAKPTKSYQMGSKKTRKGTPKLSGGEYKLTIKDFDERKTLKGQQLVWYLTNASDLKIVGKKMQSQKKQKKLKEIVDGISSSGTPQDRIDKGYWLPYKYGLKKTYGKKSSKYKEYTKKSEKQALKKSTWNFMAKLKTGPKVNCNTGKYYIDDSTGKCRETTEEDCKKDGAVCYTLRSRSKKCHKKCPYKPQQ